MSNNPMGGSFPPPPDRPNPNVPPSQYRPAPPSQIQGYGYNVPAPVPQYRPGPPVPPPSNVTKYGALAMLVLLVIGLMAAFWSVFSYQDQPIEDDDAVATALPDTDNPPTATPEPATVAPNPTQSVAALANPTQSDSTVTANPTQSVATALPPTTATATVPSATLGNANSIKLPVYPGATAVQIPSGIQGKFVETLLGTAKNARLDIYTSGDSSDKIKTFYKKAMDDASWTDVSTSLNSSSQLDPIIKAGGWILGYKRFLDVATIIQLPGDVAGSELGLNLDAGQSVLLVVTATT